VDAGTDLANQKGCKMPPAVASGHPLLADF